MIDTYHKLINVLDNVERTRDPNVSLARCPFPGCNKDPYTSRGKKTIHFHFGNIDGGWFGKCFVCHQGGPLTYILYIATGEHTDNGDVPPPPPRPEPKDPFWYADREHLQKSYTDHPEKIGAWRSYKPIKGSTVNRYEFGYGIMPYTIRTRAGEPVFHVEPVFHRGQYKSKVITAKGGAVSWVNDSGIASIYKNVRGWGILPPQHEPRLIVPLRDPTGAIVGYKGRSLDPNEDEFKWIAAAGSTLPAWGIGTVRAGDIAIIGENYVDCAMVSEDRRPDLPLAGVALGSARTLQDTEIGWLKMRDPGSVIIAMDNDLAGQATGETRARLLEEYKEKHSRAWTGGDGCGPRILKQLQDARIRAVLVDWEQYAAPEKSGVDWLLLNTKGSQHEN